MNDRRTFLALAAAAALGLVVTGRQSSASPALRFSVNHSPAEWRRLLGPQRYYILREAGTERQFTSPLLKEHRSGTFTCAGCALPLFSSATKYDSGTGWPSFWRPLPRAIATRPDPRYGYIGTAPTEVLCARCGGHLGHVFDDGPRPTGLRYCMNGLALNFRPA
ncbi:MAG: peptide-methionine (R)-S-oxide reductase MsrB [Pseudomonadota bacterium]